ncbi:ABC transporter ATP-binding protein [Dolosicoccus paucivorans]|uniref:ABC transporter ATP-binding protein n=1 Tax=Dolosicoccus paucivorans TaxID=84521 RepID=UPI0008823BD8|nr:ATP-binding cassette domain-containing protein [Dolosicoccus paucivorans]SDI79351.1 putative ABC transport system ATP-binding protein [Dolosicoccus paucivorans]
MAEPLLNIKNYSVKAKDKTLVHNINLAIQKGEFVAITGPSGTGKSTLLKGIVELLDTNLTTEGDILYKGKSVTKYDPIELRQAITYTVQSPQLFGRTVRDNLKFPYDIRDQAFNEDRAIQTLQNVGLNKSFLDKSIDTLSGGEKQRVALIRNVQFTPDILLLDEVTSALDKPTREAMWKWLADYQSEHDTTILMISHLEEEQALTDRVFNIQALDQSKEDDNE